MNRSKDVRGVACNVPEELWQVFSRKRFETGQSFQALVVEAVAKFCGEDSDKYMAKRRTAKTQGELN